MARSLLLVLMMCTVALGQVVTPVPPDPVCSSITSGTTIPFNLVNEFSVRMEIVAEESNRVTSIRMFYSQPRNQIRLQMLDAGVRSDIYFYFADNEILTFDYSGGRGSCNVNNNLTGASDTFIVGGSKDNKIQVPLAVLHVTGQSGFGNEILLTFLGTKQIREMDVNAYYSCQKWSFGPQSAIVNVTHYFSTKTWSRPDSLIVPVMIEIHGSVVLHNQKSSINHQYNFFDYQSSVDATIFETPPGIMCVGRNADVPLPNLPGYIKYSGEIVDAPASKVSYFELIYDSDEDFVVYRSQSKSDLGTEGGMNHYTTIRDYPTGLTYTIDNNKMYCTIKNISADARLPFDYVNAQRKLLEVTPQQLFFNISTKYEYLGERTIRNMIVDTWVTKTNIPQYPNEQVTVEWYFAKPDVTSWNSASAYYKNGKYRMPVLLRVWHNDFDAQAQSVDTNIYHVDYTNIMYGTLDIRSCYPSKLSNYFQIVLEGAKELVTSTNIDQFKWSTAILLGQAAGIRWIRIADMKVYYDVNDTLIEFEMLDSPPYASDISGTTLPNVNLQQATQNLNNVVTSGSLILKVWDSATNDITKGVQVSPKIKIAGNNVFHTFPPTTNPITGQTSPSVQTGPAGTGPAGTGPTTTTTPTTTTIARAGSAQGGSNDDGYSAGAMAGLGIAMIIVGGAGGGAGAHFFIK